MPLVQTIKEKTKKYRRYFLKSENESVAANTEETLFSISGQGIVRYVVITYSGDDTTGSNASTVKIEIDGNTILPSYTFGELYLCFNGSSPEHGGICPVYFPVYSNANKEYYMIFQLDTYFSSSCVIKLKNADTTNAATVRSGIVYDIEV